MVVIGIVGGGGGGPCGRRLDGLWWRGCWRTVRDGFLWCRDDVAKIEAMMASEIHGNGTRSSGDWTASTVDVAITMIFFSEVCHSASVCHICLWRVECGMYGYWDGLVSSELRPLGKHDIPYYTIKHVNDIVGSQLFEGREGRGSRVETRRIIETRDSREVTKGKTWQQ